MKLKSLYEYGIEDILFQEIGVKTAKTADLKPTSVILPQLMRIELENLKKRFGISVKWTLERIVTHGLSILQHSYSNEFKEIREAMEKLQRPEMRVIRNFMHELNVSIDGMEKPQKRNISLQEKILGALVEDAALLRIEQSSMIRLCCYCSFSTLSDAYSEIREVSLDELKRFERRLEEIAIAYNGFTEWEEIWKQKHL